MKIPLHTSMILDHFPFRLYKTFAKIELTSKTTKSKITLRPNFHYQDENNFQKIIRVNNTDVNAVGDNPKYDKLFELMDRTQKFDLLTPIPFLYGTSQNKVSLDNKNIDYLPIMEIGFYFYEPILKTFFNMIAPLILVLLLMTSTIMLNLSGVEYLGIMNGIILAVVFVTPQIRRPTTRTKFSWTDLYLILLLFGLSICAISFVNPMVKYIGLIISWLSNTIPLLGYYRYRKFTNKIITKSNKYKSIIQNPNESIKSKDDIIFKNIKPIPVKKEPWGYVMDSVVL